MKTQPLPRKATVSHIPRNGAFPYRVHFYSEGMGFDAGNYVSVGHNDYRTEKAARESAVQWENRPLHE